jgi:hypothetical protein
MNLLQCAFCENNATHKITILAMTPDYDDYFRMQNGMVRGKMNPWNNTVILICQDHNINVPSMDELSGEES